MRAVWIVAVLLTAAACQSAPAEPPAAAETAPAAPLRVLSSNGVRAVVEALLPDIGRETGRTLQAEFSTAASLKRQIDGGAPFDVAILTPVLVDDLERQGKVAPGTRVDIAKTGVGIGVPAAAPRADVSTPAALKALLLGVKSVAMTAEGQSRATVDKALAGLGITEAVLAKAMLTGPGEGPSLVAAGKADVVMTLVSEIAPVPGLQLLGEMPADYQTYVVFTAARGAAAADQAGADALLRYLGGETFAAALKTHAMQPVR